MMPARISLVMPNHNHGRFVGEAVHALLTQSRQADEIIIIDDASTDDSVDTIARLVHHRGEVSLIRRKSRGGVLELLNDGLRRATGDLIAFPAADDLLGPDFLSETEELLRRFPAAPFCSGCVVLIDSEGRRLGMRPILRPTLSADYTSADSARSMLVRGDNFFLGPVTLYRRKRLIELGGFDVSLGASSDGMMQRRMAMRWGFCFIPKVLGKWRLHGANFSAAAISSPERLDQLIDQCQRLIATEAPGLFPDGYASALERRLRFNAARLALVRGRDQSHGDNELDAICRMTRATPADRLILRIFHRLSPASTILSLGWLALRLRPLSFTWLGVETARRLVSERTLLSRS